MTVEAQKTRDPDQMQAVYLEKLADELSHRGLEAWLMAPPGRVPSPVSYTHLTLPTILLV